MVYSTCSIWPEENQHRIDAFLSRHPEFTRISESSIWPTGANDPRIYRDGGYFALLTRK